jgi:hypothetical protein
MQASAWRDWGKLQISTVWIVLVPAEILTARLPNTSQQIHRLRRPISVEGAPLHSPKVRWGGRGTIWYDMIYDMIWYDTIWYDMYLLQIGFHSAAVVNKLVQKFHSFLTFALDGDEWSVSSHARFKPAKELRHLLNKGVLGLQSRSGRSREQKRFLLLPEFEPRLVHLVA